MNHYLPSELTEVCETFQDIIDDHLLVNRAELDAFVRRPMMGALVLLREVAAGGSADGTGKGRLRPIGKVSVATQTTLEQRLTVLGERIECACDDYQSHTGIDPRTTSTDSAGQRIGAALLALDMTVERLRAQAVFRGHRQADRRGTRSPNYYSNPTTTPSNCIGRVVHRQSSNSPHPPRCVNGVR